MNADNSEIRDQGYGILYVVSTPIGNLEDITLRALRVLKGVDIIAAENVSHTRGLCEYYNIKTSLTSYNQHNRKVRTPELVKRLKSRLNVAIVTDAGTPGISDPGIYLINIAAQENIKIVPIPGPSAVIAALSVSGLAAKEFLFLGFLPNKSGKRKKGLKSLIDEPRAMVFFEAPHRIKAMLNDIWEILGNRRMVMLREMTKVFEDIKRGTVRSIIEQLPSDRTKGEFTLVVAGNEGKEKPRALSDKVLDRIEKLLAQKKMSIKDIAGLLSSEQGISYRQVYKQCLARKKMLEKSEYNGNG